MSEDQERLREYWNQLQGKGAEGILAWAASQFGAEKAALASSFGVEDQVLTHMLAGLDPRPRIFTLDTGRLFQETYDVMQRTVARYGLAYEVYAPDAGELKEMVSQNGPNLFYESVEKRTMCCEVRKTGPLKRVLGTVDAWICGLRREQSVTRDRIEVIEWDARHGIFKISPLFDWSEQQTWDYVRSNGVPYNQLHDQGFRSIGCRPCTRAVKEGEDVRAGRWWWESPEHKECGLHRRSHES